MFTGGNNFEWLFGVAVCKGPEGLISPVLLGNGALGGGGRRRRGRGEAWASWRALR